MGDVAGADRRAEVTGAGPAPFGAAIFDMDGLLVDSEPLWHEAEVEVLGSLGVPIALSDVRHTKGMPMIDVVRYWHERSPWDGPSTDEVAARIVDRVTALIGERATLQPGVDRAVGLCRAHGLPLALASSSEHRVIDFVLARFGLASTFPVTCSAEDEPYGKPHPGVFITTAHRIGVVPDRCLVWEDAPAGVLAAKAARMTCVAVPEPEDRNHPWVLLADAVLSSLEEADEELWSRLVAARHGCRPRRVPVAPCANLQRGRPGPSSSLGGPTFQETHVFRPLAPDADFVTLETEELERWHAHKVFERSVAQRAGAREWVFYEGPPTANNRPGLHHVWARVYKDLFCRYRTMRGFKVDRRAGWDTHGLPVEVEVEKRLGVNGKRQIEEEIGVAEFVRLCRESVLNYVSEWERLTERIGYWVDLDDAYWTFDRSYIESVWWHLKCLFDKGLLYEDLKVVPYCPRCGTALSSHELGQPEVYTDEEDESAYVKLPLVDAPGPGGAEAFVVWTTTPWTLVSNTGVAVHPDLTYVVVDGLVVAEVLADEVLGEGAGDRASARLSGRDLAGLRYRRPLDVVAVPPGEDASAGWRVVLSRFVTTREGTGLVHLAPAFGEEDREVAKAEGLPTLNPVGPDGRFTESAGWLAGRAVRDTNTEIDDRLEADGLLLRRHLYRHAYPHCWRCGTALIYWGKPSWYVATLSRKADLVAANKGVEWHPDYIKTGRFGEWLDNNVDWALSRDRYWGTPLPIWRCDDGHVLCVGSLAELSDLAGRDVTGLDPHRPVIDEVEVPCPECAGLAGAQVAAGSATGYVGSELPIATARRVEPVIDAWFDSGSMPAAQVGYPHAPGSKHAFRFPADFIAEAIDQTRGWFYSLLAVNTLVFGKAPYRHVMCLGLLVDAEGRKMSKSLGNVIDPWDLVTSRGADPLRWWMFSQGSPWTPTRVSLGAIDASLRDTLLTLWHTVGFFTTYASLNGFDPWAPDAGIPDRAERPALDRWALSRVASTVLVVTVALDSYEPLEAATALGRLVDDLSNWYVRRSRRRFWRTDPDAPPADALAAQATLHEALVAVSLMLAPFCPFVADRLWRVLVPSAPDDASVHLSDWPKADDAALDPALEEQMALARRLSSLGRAARSEAGVRVRQPLARALVFLAPGAPPLLADVVADELNVDEVVVASELSDVLSLELVPNFRVLGPRLGEAAKEVRAALALLDAAAGAAALEAGGTVTVDLSSGPVALGPDEVEVRVQGQPGYAVSREGGEVVALDLAVDDDLLRRGVAREVVRRVQDLRKERGLEVSDRIRLWLTGVERSLYESIGREVLAVEVSDGPGPGEGALLEGTDGGRAWLEKA